MDLVIRLDQKSSLPMYRRLAQAICEAIACGRLQAGQMLPSTRELADSLGVSRITVRKSYDELVAQGYAKASTGSGTYVAKRLPDAAEQIKQTKSVSGTTRAVRLSGYGQRVADTAQRIPADQELFAELNYGIPTLDQLPLSVWRKLLLKPLPAKQGAALKYLGDPLGHKPLREALAGYLSRARAVRCQPDQIALFSGVQPALDLLCRLLIEPGDHVAIEDPGYPGARRTFVMHGAIIHSLAVDEHGLRVSELNALPKPPRVIYVTPSHQDPTGVVLSLPRRMELLAYARKHDCFVIEDDNDSEFRYGTAAVPSLQGLDVDDCVVYASTFWRTLGPMVVLGFVVLPRRLRHIFTAAKAMIERDLPLLEQYALSDFIADGYLERHIRKTRALYGKRRSTLAHALTVQLGKQVKISPETAGMHMIVKFAADLSEPLIKRCAQESALAVQSTRPYYSQRPLANQFLIPFAHLGETELSAAVEKFARLLIKYKND